MKTETKGSMRGRTGLERLGETGGEIDITGNKKILMTPKANFKNHN